MKKMMVLLAVVFCASMAYATDYNPLTDWVDAPGTPAAWSYGARIETGYATGVFGDLILGVHKYTAPFTDRYEVPNTAHTCVVGKTDPWQSKPGPLMNAWTTYQATARLTPEAGIYDIAGSYTGTGYASPSIQLTNVYVVKNGSNILWQGLVNDYHTPASFALTGVTLNAGDYVDFISANGADAGESRTSLTALVRIPEPATMSLLALGVLGLLRRRRS